MKKLSKQRGFTLIELMVVLAIASILLLVAVPSMQRSLKKSAVSGHQRDFISALSYARGEASVRGRSVSMCPSSDASTCQTSAYNWSDGWLVFVETGAAGVDGILQADDELIRAYKYEGSNTLTLVDPLASNTPLTKLSWSERGFSVNGQRALAVICESGGDTDFARGVMLASSGRVIATRNLDTDTVHETVFEKDDGGLSEAELTCP